MGKPIIATARLSDAATLTGSSAVGSMSLSALQTKQPSDVWRPGELTPWVMVDLGADKKVSLVALISLNASSTAQWRVRGHTSSAGLLTGAIYDAGWSRLRPAGSSDEDPAFIALKVMPSQMPDPSPMPGWIDSSAVLGLNFTSDEGYFSYVPQLRYWRIDISDPDNISGYLDFGRLYISDAVEMSLYAVKGLSIGYSDASKKQRAMGGQRYTVVRPPERYIDFQIDYGTAAEMMGTTLHRDLTQGISHDVLCTLNADEPTYLAQTTIYGELASLEPVILPQYKTFQRRFKIEELLP